MGVSKEGALRMAIQENSDPSFNPAFWLDIARGGDDQFKNIIKKRLKLVKILQTGLGLRLK